MHFIPLFLFPHAHHSLSHTPSHRTTPYRHCRHALGAHHAHVGRHLLHEELVHRNTLTLKVPLNPLPRHLPSTPVPLPVRCVWHWASPAWGASTTRMGSARLGCGAWTAPLVWVYPVGCCCPWVCGVCSVWAPFAAVRLGWSRVVVRGRCVPAAGRMGRWVGGRGRSGQQRGEVRRPPQACRRPDERHGSPSIVGYIFHAG